jgi:elongation factor P
LYGGFCMITANELRNGKAFELDGELFVVTSFQHIKPGKGSPFVRIKMRGIKSNSTIERTFRPDEKIQDAYLENKKMQYLYKDGDHYIFMDTENYEQLSLSEKELEEESNYLIENNFVDIVFYNDQAIGVELPTSINLRVASTEPGYRGDTAQGGSKPATLETGLEIQVPLFIEEGDLLKVDTRSGEYIERVNS